MTHKMRISSLPGAAPETTGKSRVSLGLAAIGRPVGIYRYDLRGL